MIGLRAMLEQERTVRVIGEAPVPEVTQSVVQLHPDAVALCGDGNAELLMPMARQVRDIDPSIILLFIADSMDYGVGLPLSRSRGLSLVLWRDITSVSLHWLLGGILDGGWQILSPDIVEAMVLPTDRIRQRQQESLGLNDQAQTVLHGLVHGLSDVELAHEIHRSDRTVRRVLSALQGKLGASCRAELIACATELGFRD